MDYLKVFIDAVVIWLSVYIIGILLFNRKSKKILLGLLLTVIFSLIIVGLNAMNLDGLGGVIKILTIYILQCIFYKTIFDVSMSRSMMAALIYYLCMFLSEIFIAITVSIITNIAGTSMQFTKHDFIMNGLISLISCTIVLLFREKFSQFTKMNRMKDNSYIGIIAVILITLALLVFRIPFSNWEFDMEFIITMLILLSFTIIAIYLLKQRSDIQKTSSMYNKVVEYSKTTNKLLEDYRIVNHEHKNQLSIIRTMTNKSNKELLNYIDNLLDKKNVVKYQWITELNNLPSEGLKGLINYKLVQMENENINPTVTISKDVAKTKLNKLSTKQMDNLYSIVGVYLDNAIEAASKSKEKEVSLDVYKDKKEIVMILANTYKGKINLDKMDEYGYTTKGKNHGVGLHLVRKILEEDTMFKESRKLLDNYYIQELRIDLTIIKSKKKKK